MNIDSVVSKHLTPLYNILIDLIFWMLLYFFLKKKNLAQENRFLCLPIFPVKRPSHFEEFFIWLLKYVRFLNIHYHKVCSHFHPFFQQVNFPPLKN
jgi:hypothetical protein